MIEKKMGSATSPTSDFIARPVRGLRQSAFRGAGTTSENTVANEIPLGKSGCCGVALCGAPLHTPVHPQESAAPLARSRPTRLSPRHSNCNRNCNRVTAMGIGGPPHDLERLVAVVTGAAGGIGR